MDSEDSDQTGRMPFLICVFAERTAILFVLSYRGSIIFYLNHVSIASEDVFVLSFVTRGVL